MSPRNNSSIMIMSQSYMAPKNKPKVYHLRVLGFGDVGFGVAGLGV